jgi:putative endonuclease
MLSRMIFALIRFAARNGLAQDASAADAKQRARRTGVRGETYAYWYLRRHGYVLIARNYTAPGIKGEIDLIGYDGLVLAFVEVKTRSGAREEFGRPEDAVTPDKMHALGRMARQFLAERRVFQTQCRFDVLAIESPPGKPPVVRLHKGAFSI